MKTPKTFICLNCAREFPRNRPCQKWCGAPECRRVYQQLYRARQKTAWTKYFNKNRENLYETRKSFRNQESEEYRKKKRLCRGRTQSQFCHYYINNANRYFCSACHTRISRNLAAPEEVFGGGFDEGLAENHFLLS